MTGHMLDQNLPPDSPCDPSVSTDQALSLPTPYPEYLPCPHCGEPEVEIWCYETGRPCHACGGWIKHEVPPNCHPPKEVTEELGNLFHQLPNS